MLTTLIWSLFTLLYPRSFLDSFLKYFIVDFRSSMYLPLSWGWTARNTSTSAWNLPSEVDVLDVLRGRTTRRVKAKPTKTRIKLWNTYFANKRLRNICGFWNVWKIFRQFSFFRELEVTFMTILLLILLLYQFWMKKVKSLDDFFCGKC